MKKNKNVYILVCIVLVSFFSCSTRYRPTAVGSVYSKKGDPFLHVYCENEFDFKQKGVVTGSFKLSKQTSFDNLDAVILIPEVFRKTPEGKFNFWHGSVKLSVKIVFEWDGKDGRHKSETQTYNYPESQTSDGFISISNFELPRNKKIDYKLSFNAGDYFVSTGRKYKLFYYHKESKTDEDKTSLLETAEGKKFWKARFFVAELPVKGKGQTRGNKPFKDQ